jgi:hypothetical protein
MLSNLTQLLAPTEVATSVAAIYTAPSGQNVEVSRIFAHNHSGANTNVLKLHLVPSGGSATDANMIFYESLGTNTDLADPSYFDGLVLEPGDAIYAVTDNANDVVITISGRKQN